MMIATKYYRQYLWIFFYLFFVLFGVAIVVDTVKDASGNGNGNGNAKLVRFLWTLGCFLFGGAGVLLQTYGTKKLLGLELLNVNRKKWRKKYVYVKKKCSRKKCSASKIPTLFCLHVGSNLISLLPLLIIGSLIIASAWDTVKNTVQFDSCKWFLFLGILIKHAAWYLTTWSSKVSIFWNRKRLNNMI